MRKLVLAVLFGLFLAIMPALAQTGQSTPLVPGEPFEGEITKDTFAFEFSYKGAKDEVIVLRLTPKERFGDLSSPAVIIKDSRGNEILNYDYFGEIYLAWQLPSDDDYTIIATRYDGAAGDSVGEFTFELIKPQELKTGESVQGTISNENRQFYLYTGDADFTLSYSKTGNFSPELSVNTINTRWSAGSLDPVGAVYGPSINQATLGVFKGRNVYIVQLKEAFFDFNFDRVTTDYTLTLTEAK